VGTTESSAAHAHPSTEEHDDSVEAHYSGLERLRPCACMNGTVFIGHLVVDEAAKRSRYSKPYRAAGIPTKRRIGEGRG
jgi:hypothetical protein